MNSSSHERRTVEGSDSEALLRNEGLNPAEWSVKDYRTWGPEDAKQHYLSVIPKKPEGLLIPARLDGPRRKAQPVRQNEPYSLAAFISDQHVPYHDERLHELTCQWLEDNEPEQVVIGGDLVEFDTISRHRKIPDDKAVQKGIDAGYAVLRDYVEAAPRASFSILPGNHCVRLQNYVLDVAPALYGLRPGSLADEPQVAEALSLQTLWRCDELGIAYIGGSYEDAQVAITPKLAARHGWIANKGAGRSAMRHLEVLGHGVVHGHTHRQAVVHRTVYDVDGTPSTQVAIEAGAMCQLELAKTYSTNADWQQGFATFTVYPDGTFHPELATYVKDSLHWRGERYV